MDKKRFQLNKDSEWWFVQDNTIQVNEYGYRDDLTGEDKYRGLKQDLTEQETVDLLNDLVEENDKLRELIKENVFGRYREGSLADLEFKATAYDDIVKLEISNDSEPKVIVICKQGKKENVKSFCQMFIPFGVYYEIKEDK